MAHPQRHVGAIQTDVVLERTRSLCFWVRGKSFGVGLRHPCEVPGNCRGLFNDQEPSWQMPNQPTFGPCVNAPKKAARTIRILATKLWLTA